MEKWETKFKKDKRKYYFDGYFRRLEDVLTIVSNYYSDHYTFYKVAEWMDFAKVGDSTRLNKIDKVLARVR